MLSHSRYILFDAINIIAGENNSEHIQITENNFKMSTAFLDLHNVLGFRGQYYFLNTALLGPLIRGQETVPLSGLDPKRQI